MRLVWGTRMIKLLGETRKETSQDFSSFLSPLSLLFHLQNTYSKYLRHTPAKFFWFFGFFWFFATSIPVLKWEYTKYHDF